MYNTLKEKFMKNLSIDEKVARIPNPFMCASLGVADCDDFHREFVLFPNDEESETQNNIILQLETEFYTTQKAHIFYFTEGTVFYSDEWHIDYGIIDKIIARAKELDSNIKYEKRTLYLYHNYDTMELELC